MERVFIDYREEAVRARTMLVLGLLMLFTVGSALWVLATDVPELTGASWYQRRIIAEMGEPSAFTITYLPLGERRRVELVRTEEWFYPEHGQSISFVAGRIVSVDAIEEGRPAALAIKPWEVGPKTSAEEIERSTGAPSQAVPDRLVAGIAGDAVVFVSKRAIFAIENGLLLHVRIEGGPNPL